MSWRVSFKRGNKKNLHPFLCVRGIYDVLYTTEIGFQPEDFLGLIGNLLPQSSFTVLTFPSGSLTI
jgi:hypothetical protein